MISKVLSNRIKNLLPNLISWRGQVNIRYFRDDRRFEHGRLSFNNRCWESLWLSWPPFLTWYSRKTYRLYDENFYEWNLILSYLIKIIFCENFKFHPKNVPNCYKETITIWVKYLSCSPSLPSAILSQVLWFHLNIKIDNKSIFISDFASESINFVGQIFHESGKTKSWNYIKSEYNLESKLKYRWVQLTDALPKLSKDRILNCIGNSMNLCIFYHHLIKKNNLYCLNKLGSRKLYQIQIS